MLSTVYEWINRLRGVEQALVPTDSLAPPDVISTIDAAATVAEEAGVSIDERMKRVALALERGQFKQIQADERTSLINDLNAILDFVDAAMRIMEKFDADARLKVSVTRLRRLRTRIANYQKTTQQASR